MKQLSSDKGRIDECTTKLNDLILVSNNEAYNRPNKELKDLHWE